MAKRKDPITQLELFEYLSRKVCEITYTPLNSSRKKVKVTLMKEWIKKLDNYPIGFDTDQEAAMFDPGCINCLNIDTNQWLTIPIKDILTISVP